MPTNGMLAVKNVEILYELVVLPAAMSTLRFMSVQLEASVEQLIVGLLMTKHLEQTPQINA